MLAFVAYYRVSTDRQGESGLGLEAQRSSVAQFIKGASLLGEFQEFDHLQQLLVTPLPAPADTHTPIPQAGKKHGQH